MKILLFSLGMEKEVKGLFSWGVNRHLSSISWGITDKTLLKQHFKWKIKYREKCDGGGREKREQRQ